MRKPIYYYDGDFIVIPIIMIIISAFGIVMYHIRDFAGYLIAPVIAFSFISYFAYKDISAYLKYKKGK